MKKLEKQLIEIGYELVDEQPPFKIYEIHKKRIIYHYPSGKIWGSFRLNFYKNEKEEKCQ